MTPLISPPRGLRFPSPISDSIESTPQRLLARILEGGEAAGAVSQALERGLPWERAVQSLPVNARARFSQESLASFSALSRESNRGNFHRDLLALGRRVEISDPEIAARIYSVLDATRDWSATPGTALQAAQRLEILRGGGPTAARLERFAGSFLGQVTDPAMLVGMGVAGMAYRGMRLAVMSRLAAGGVANFPRTGLALASLAGFAAEVPAFSLAVALTNTARGRTVDWSAGGVATSLGHGLLMLGSMRLSSGLVAGLGRRWFGASTPSLRMGALQQVGMFGGILGSQQLEIHFGLRPETSLQDRLAEGLGTLLLFNASGQLARALYGRRWAAFERDLEVQTRRLSAAPNPEPIGENREAPMIGRIPPGDMAPAMNLHVRAPGVPGPRRLIPHLATFQHIFDPVSTGILLLRSGQKVMGVAEGSAGTVLVNDAELARTVLSDRETWLRAGTPLKAPSSHPHIEIMSNSVLFLNGESWRMRRRILMPPVSKASIMAGMGPTFERTFNEITENWLTAGSINLLEQPLRLTLRNNMRGLVGLEPAAGEAIAGQMHTFLSGFLSPFVLATQQLGRGRVIPGSPYARWLAAGDRLHESLVSLIEAKRANPSNDALGTLIASVDEESGRPLSNDEVVGELVSFYGAGHETTARTLGWTMWLLAHHPAIAERAAQEVRDVLQGRPPSHEDLPRLRYLDNVIDESQRLMTIVAATLPRAATREVRLGGILLPAGSNAAVSIFAQHHDPAVFSRPGTFQPERWQNGPKLDPYQFLPFGAGPRRCLGGVFAAWQLRSTVALMLQRFSFQAVTSHVDYAFSNAALRPKSSLPLRVVPPGGWRESAPLTGTITRLVHPES